MIEYVDADWSIRDFSGLDLGDGRLNRRLLVLAEAFGTQPEAPINQASGDWHATKAAYAFFANPKRNRRTCWHRIRPGSWNGWRPIRWFWRCRTPPF